MLGFLCDPPLLPPNYPPTHKGCCLVTCAVDRALKFSHLTCGVYSGMQRTSADNTMYCTTPLLQSISDYHVLLNRINKQGS